MENGSFQALRLGQFDFNEFEKTEARQEADQFSLSHSNQSASRTSAAPSRSSTIEALMNQNEDLMARLKVALRKSADLEESLQEIQSEFRDTTDRFASQNDQMLVWREKENFWKLKNQTLEKEVETLKARFPDLINMEAQLARLKRYQERVKTQIKPYVQDLKRYANSLQEEIQNLQTELAKNESKTIELGSQLFSEKERFETEREALFKIQNQIVHEFEQERSLFLGEIKALKEMNVELELRTQRLDQSLLRQDELENTVIALRRSKEEIFEELQKKSEDTQNENGSLRGQNTELQMRLEDRVQLCQSQSLEIQNLNAKLGQLEEQLGTARFLWTQKNEEFEKMKLSMSGLERLNLELSLKLTELRKSPAQK
jgi:chromosome segregation ATPase